MASAERSKDTEECTRRVFEAVNNNSFSLFISATNTYSEIQLLTSLAECNDEGETPLAIAIKSNYFSIVKELTTLLKRLVLNHNIEENELKLTFVINQLLNQFPIKELIDSLIYDQYRCEQSSKWLMFISKNVLKSISLTRQDKIILLEVIGTALIIQLNRYEITEEKALCGNYGLECWREAMTLRYFPTDGGDLLPKLPNFNVPSESPSFIFGSAVEFATMEELDLLREDFQHNYLPDVGMRIPCAKRMVIQALLVSRRISAHEQLGHPHWLYLESLLNFPNVCMFEDNIGINPHLFIVEELNGSDSNLVPLSSYDVFIRTLRELSDKFVQQLSEPPNSPKGRELNYANLLMITKSVTTIQCNHPHFQNCDYSQRRVLYVVCRLVFVLNSISSRITKEEQQILEKFYCDYIQGFPERTHTVLHEAVSTNTCDYTNYQRLQTIKRLLQFGADPNAIDEFGETPLYRLVGKVREFNADKSVPLFQVLLDAGAHLDVATNYGTTALRFLKKMLKGKVHPYFESLINSVFPLSCYCARVIQRHGIPINRLPPRLKKLVSIHSPEDSIDLERKGIEEHAHKKRKI